MVNIDLDAINDLETAKGVILKLLKGKRSSRNNKKNENNKK